MANAKTEAEAIKAARENAAKRFAKGSPNDPVDIDSEHADVMSHLQGGLLPPRDPRHATPGGMRQGIEPGRGV